LDFFDGASIAGGSNCGAGGSLKRLNEQDVRWFINCGEGSNTKVELMGAWAAMTIANLLGFHHIQMLGDSKVVIDWLGGKCHLQATQIEGWKRRTRILAQSFQDICFQHIYRESNAEADRLSKQALLAPKGRLTYYYWDGVSEGPHQFMEIY
jgi:ribonuclease HI